MTDSETGTSRSDNASGDTEREEWVLILTMWPSDRRGFERPALERFDDQETAEDVRQEYASNDGLHPSDYTVRKRENVDSLPFDVSFGDCNTRYLRTGTEQSDRGGSDR